MIRRIKENEGEKKSKDRGVNHDARVREEEQGEKGKFVPSPPCGNLSQPGTPRVRGN